nr:hypothetical protein [Sunxiuqinia sp.]
MELLYPPSKPQIPWQGTVLGIIGVAQILFSILFLFIALFGIAVGGLFTSFAIPDLGAMIPSLAIGVIVLLMLFIGLPLFILKVVVTIGIFRGKRWAVIITIVFAALGFIANMGNFNFIWLIFSAVELGLAIVCLSDPFYNQSRYIPDQSYRSNY